MKIKVNRGSRHHAWGRFGGGWNWILGFQAGGSTLILNLLTFSVRIDFRRGKATLQ